MRRKLWVIFALATLVLATGAAWFLRAAGDSALLEKYGQIRIGMPLEEVTHLIGGPGRDSILFADLRKWDKNRRPVSELVQPDEFGLMNLARTRFWCRETSLLLVSLGENDRICATSLSLGRHLSWLERVRDWLGW